MDYRLEHLLKEMAKKMRGNAFRDIQNLGVELQILILTYKIEKLEAGKNKKV